MWNIDNKHDADQSAFTLMEVLFALIISGIFLSLALRLLTTQWRSAIETKRQMELQYCVMVGGRTVVDAIRSAKRVEMNDGVLKVEAWDAKGVIYKDSYYIADKDYDGIKDLYCEHENVPNPVVSRINNFSCEEAEPGLWYVRLQAVWGKQKATWETAVHRRTP